MAGLRQTVRTTSRVKAVEFLGDGNACGGPSDYTGRQQVIRVLIHIDHTPGLRGGYVRDWADLGSFRMCCLRLDRTVPGGSKRFRCPLANLGADHRGRTSPDRLYVDQEFKKARNAFRGPNSSGFKSRASQDRSIRPPNNPPRIRTNGIQFHSSLIGGRGGRI
jgi:hypothetical protein